MNTEIVHASHGPSRRGFLGFLGGCFAAMATNAIPAAGVTQEPRYWLRTEALPLTLHPYQSVCVIAYTGARNDGKFFFTREFVSVAPTQEIVADCRHRLRLQLNEFLGCDCAVGYFCRKHRNMDPKTWPDEDMAELAEVAVQSI